MTTGSTLTAPCFLHVVTCPGVLHLSPCSWDVKWSSAVFLLCRAKQEQTVKQRAVTSLSCKRSNRGDKTQVLGEGRVTFTELQTLQDSLTMRSRPASRLLRPQSSPCYPAGGGSPLALSRSSDLIHAAETFTTTTRRLLRRRGRSEPR